MAEPKTKKTKASPTAFISAIKDPQKKADSKALLQLMQKASGEKPSVWGNGMIGFGQYHYKSERSSQEGDWPLTAFSPRAANLTVYIMSGAKKYPALLKKLGKHTMSGGSCVYIKKLSDIDQSVLKKLVQTSVNDMKKMYK